MKINIIVATDLNGGIGKNNQLLCHLPNDLKHFKKLTLGKPIIMGRKTFDSIGKALPGRTNIVVSRGKPDLPEGVLLASSLDEALSFAANMPEVCIIGGGSIYKEALGLADFVYLTRIVAAFEADVFFQFDAKNFSILDDIYHPADSLHAYAFRFFTLQRIKKAVNLF